jgi:hypothetical protein
MDRRRRSGLSVVGWVVGIVVVVLVAFPLVANLLYSDYERSPIALGEPDAGAQVYLEEGDEVALALHGHPGHRSTAWELVSDGGSVVSVLRTNHEPDGSALPDDFTLSFIDQPLGDALRAVRSGPPDQIEGDERLWFVPMTTFAFEGAGPGSTEVRLELRVGGETIARFAFTVEVVDDACNYFEGQESPIKVPHRCG